MSTAVDAILREEKGKDEIKRVRKENRIPAIMYGHEFEPVMLSLDGHDFMSLLRREGGIHGLVDLKVEGKKGGKHTVVVKEIQRHPIKDIVLHVDFMRVKETETLQTEVPILYHGEPEGVKLGGLLQHFLYAVRVETLPKDLPERLDVDISGMKIGQSFKVSDLPEIPGVTYLNSPEETIVSVVAKRIHVPLIGEEGYEEEGAEAAASESAEGEAAATE